MYCRDCDYPLKGLADPRCPECGRGFDAGDPGTYWKRRSRDGFGTLATRLCLAALVANVAWYFLLCWQSRVTTVWPDIYSSLSRAFDFWMVVWGYAAIAGGTFLFPLLWIGAKMKRCAPGVIFCVLLPPMLAEGLARCEEHLFVRDCQALQPTVFQLAGRGHTVYARRWWPNQKHLMVYNQTTHELIDGN